MFNRRRAQACKDHKPCSPLLHPPFVFRLFIIQLVVAGVPAPSCCGNHGSGLTSGIVTGPFDKRRMVDNFNRKCQEMEQRTRTRNQGLCLLVLSHPPPCGAQGDPKVTSLGLRSTPHSQQPGDLTPVGRGKWKKNSEGAADCSPLKTRAGQEQHPPELAEEGHLPSATQSFSLAIRAAGTSHAADNEREWAGWENKDRQRKKKSRDTYSDHTQEHKLSRVLSPQTPKPSDRNMPHL